MYPKVSSEIIVARIGLARPVFRRTPATQGHPGIVLPISDAGTNPGVRATGMSRKGGRRGAVNQVEVRAGPRLRTRAETGVWRAASFAAPVVVILHNTENGRMTSAGDSDERIGSAAGDALERLRAQILSRWSAFPGALGRELDALLAETLERAAQARPEVLTVMDPASRPQRLRLATVVGSADLDSFYHNEWAELAISHDGRLFLVYRRRDGGDYAVTWSQATTIPIPVMEALPDVLATAMLENDGAED